MGRPLWALAFVAMLSIPICAQPPAFEVASIRANREGGGVTVLPGLRNGTLRATNVTIRHILMAAYGLTESRVIGPDWLDKDHFDLSAKSPHGVADNEMKPMLQALLKDRFQLAAHSDVREMPVYELVVVKGGVKMSVYPAPERPEIPHPPGVPMMRGTMTTSRLADSLSGFSGRPVLDRTGLSERYNFSLVFAPLSPRADGNAVDLPDLFTALQEQLGLKLQPAKENLDVIVIDHIERMPSEN